MPDLLNILSGEVASFLKFAVLLLALPFLYMRNSIELRQREEFQAAFRSLAAGGKVSTRLEAKLHFFDLQVLLIAAMSVLLGAISVAGNVAYLSDRFPDVEPSLVEARRMELRQEGPAMRLMVEVDSKSQDAETDPRRQVVSILNVFALVLALLALFWVQWSKLQAYRALDLSRADGT